MMIKGLTQRLVSRNGRKVLRYLTLSSAAALMLSSAIAGSGSEISKVSEFGRWGVFCTKPQTSSEDCAVTQASTDNANGVFAGVAFHFLADGRIGLRLETNPIYGDEKRAILFVDGLQVGVLNIASCSNDTCSATTSLDRPLINTLIDGGELAVQTKLKKDQSVTIGMSLDDLDSALNAAHGFLLSSGRVASHDAWTDLYERRLAKNTDPAIAEVLNNPRWRDQLSTQTALANAKACSERPRPGDPPNICKLPHDVTTTMPIFKGLNKREGLGAVFIEQGGAKLE